jgi:septal ring factor EnvC (AmiA/AmiB activator)
VIRPLTLVLALALAQAPGAPAAAAGPAEALAEAGARLTAATEAAATAPHAAGQADALAAAVAGYERALARLRDAALEAEAEARALRLDLALRRQEIGRLLASLQALSRAGDPATGLHPQGPLAAARAARMLGHMMPALRAEAAALETRLEAIRAAETARARSVAAIDAGLVRLAEGRGALLAALQDGEPTPSGVALAGREAPAALARDADTLSGLAAAIAGLGADGAGAGSAAPLALRWPAAGAVRAGFGAEDAAGVRRPGLLVAAPPLALVTAPAAGLVRYAGPFLDYGYVVVLEPRADVLIVLAGLATLRARGGDRVEAGALLGLLGGGPIDAQQYLMLGQSGNDATPAETLYIELRHGQGPVDPAAWFEDGNG